MQQDLNSGHHGNPQLIKGKGVYRSTHYFLSFVQKHRLRVNSAKYISQTKDLSKAIWLEDILEITAE